MNHYRASDDGPYSRTYEAELKRPIKGWQKLNECRPAPGGRRIIPKRPRLSRDPATNLGAPNEQRFLASGLAGLCSPKVLQRLQRDWLACSPGWGFALLPGGASLRLPLSCSAMNVSGSTDRRARVRMTAPPARRRRVRRMADVSCSPGRHGKTMSPREGDGRRGRRRLIVTEEL